MPTLVNDLKAIGKLITLAHTQGGKFGLALHDAAYNCLAHAINTGDVRPMQSLYEKLAPAAKAALKAWAVKYGPFRLDPELGNLKHYSKNASLSLADAEAIAPMDYQREIKPKTAHVFDLKVEIEKLVKRATSHNISGKPIEFLHSAAKAA